MSNNPKIHRIHLPETDSTNSTARAIASGGNSCLHEVLLVTTDHQTAGRGQRGNTWESEEGKNLLFSLVIYPHALPAAQQFVICELVSVALCEALSRYTSGIQIKWPNDIYYHDHKLGGILIEHDIEGTNLSRTIIGIGLNVNQTRFTSDAPNPISLHQILGKAINRESLLSAISESILEHLAVLDTETSEEPLSARKSKKEIHRSYLAQLYRRDVPAQYRDEQGVFTAILRHVLPDGRIILEDVEGKCRQYLFKEVAYII